MPPAQEHRRTTHPARRTRRTFTIFEQLQGKLGVEAADDLVSAMHSLTRRTRKRSRRR